MAEKPLLVVDGGEKAPAEPQEASEPDAPLRCEIDDLPSLGDLRAPTPDGFLGLAGGVWEWVQDGYAPYPSNPPEEPVVDPVGPDDAAERVQKGGSYLSESVLEFRAAGRGAVAAEARLPDVGFRCAWSPPR